MPASSQSEGDANVDGAFIDPTQPTILDKLTVPKKSDLAVKERLKSQKVLVLTKNGRLVHLLTPIPRLSLLLPV